MDYYIEDMKQIVFIVNSVVMEHYSAIITELEEQSINTDNLDLSFEFTYGDENDGFNCKLK